MRKIFTILLALLAIGQVWAATAKIEGTNWDNNRSWTGNFVTFTFSGENASYSNGATGTYLQIKANKTYTVSWAVNECHAINVTQIKAKFGNASISSYDVYFNSTKCGKVNGWSTNDNIYLGGLSLGNEGNINVSTTRDANIYWIEITYTMGSNTYSVVFHADDATSGEMSNQAFSYDAAQNLTTNAFVRSYTVNYNADGGECAEASAAANYTFAGWATAAGGVVVYTNGQNVKNLTKVDGGLIDLYATWNSASVTLPAATKDGFLFNGWYNGENYVGKAGDVITPDADMNLTAYWADKLTPQFTLDKTEIELEQVAVLTLTNVDEPAITFAPEGIVSYNAETGELTGITVGEVAITISQAAKTSIAAKEETLTLTVTKKTPSLAVLLNDVEGTDFILNPTLSATLGFNKVSDAEVEVALVSGSEFVTLEEGVVTALMNEGSAVLSATLAETETYKTTSVEFTVQVARATEATDCYVLVENDQHSIGMYDNNAGLEYTLSGPGEKLYVKVGKFSNVATNNINIYGYRKDGSEAFHVEYSVGELTTGGEDKEIAISEDVTKIKFKAGGTLSKWFSNVRVTRKTYLRAENVALEAEKDHACEGTLNVNYSIANGGDLKIVCDNEKFVLDSYVIENVDCRGGVANISVSYPSDVEIEDTANVVIYNAVYRAEVLLTAKIIPSKNTYADYTAYFCQGESVEFEGVVYSEATTTQVLLAEKNIMGGDSIVNLTVIELVPDTTVLNETMYLGDILIVDPNEWALLIDEIEYQFEEAEYPLDAEVPVDLIQHTQSVNGCDSTIIRHIEVVDPLTTGINSVETNPVVQATKELRDGVIYIRRGESLYLIDGKRVK